ncbi:sporulation protein YqfC [Tissierella praeacuta]|uniref:Sporulation protein YqfC n=1 Tax=Tissierella praeacuta DSM 18095 TaxID=1123404 RepID=A0A1M4S990_9FIRM|nr:sporulation protein YqfC [Tissierella praeacuta]MBU5254972.1 sporulation protein YqfC [Tissierella praeacuta]TCU71723.1 sporulation protein YqfC [Tissierella praeacuta]SHE28607.1 sporulation protein YqfC [Tissierella praeacuta DSM 18095]SUP01125.1 sporulation protein YqfC [Tissierella praeacuta]
MKRQIENVKYNISEALELPIDIMMDLPRLTLIGNVEVSLLNHKGIIEYTKEVIRINTKVGIFKITGEELEIKTILSEEIIIVGLINDIEIIS